MAELITNAEFKAQEATKLSSFNKINLCGIKDSLEEMLGMIGRDGIFDEYTKHDISHVNTMLTMLDMLIPLKTQQIMTSADWLLMVLSFYLHDLGMLVTKNEYKNRKNNSIYNKYRKDYLSNVSNADSLKTLTDEEKERFIYQEYVRLNHGNRIADWLNKENNDLYDKNVIDLVQKMISGLKPILIRDIAKICRSHNDDLDDQIQFPVREDYGMSPQEKGNVYYAALMLRTADLLHITDNRCPSEQYQIIAPSNPISQIEWAKQASVTSVSVKEQINDDGVVDKSIQSDTLIVTGYFEDPKGFFPLMDYLNYAREELLHSYRINEEVKKKNSYEYEFPWKNIDDSKVDTKEYERHQLSFTIDQHKILDLLVGETLYNNITVSLREIAQNAIDAVKVKKYELDEKKDYSYIPKVVVTWNSDTSQLIVSDNGTGMDIDIIKNHLLKVGSSRYRDKDFIKAHSNYNPISRFGIGLLSCFLVADDVDILTKMDGSKPLLLKVSKLHGKYLLKHGQEKDSPLCLLEKDASGTSIMLKIRPGLNFNPEKILQEWIIFPGCSFTYKTDKNTKEIGYNSTSDLLLAILHSRGLSADGLDYKIIGQNERGLDLSILLKKNKYLKDWSFVDYSEIIRNDSIDVMPCGLCIEGIRIDSNSPGFKVRNIMAIANLYGKDAPQTNVARSAINTQTLDKTLSRIYQSYLIEIDKEIKQLSNDYSKTWASSELPFLLDKFSNEDVNDGRDRLVNKSLFKEALINQKYFLIEKDGKRHFYSLYDLIQEKHFWTIDSVAYQSANNLIREVKSSDLSVINILKGLYGDNSPLLTNIDILLSSRSYMNLLDTIIKEHFEVQDIFVFAENRSMNLYWTVKDNNNPLWLTIDNSQMIRRYYHESYYSFFVQNGTINCSTKEYEAIRSDFGLFLLEGNAIHKYLKGLFDMNKEDDFWPYVIQTICLFFNYYFQKANKDVDWSRAFDDYLSRNYSENYSKKLRERLEIKDLLDVCSQSKFSIYDKNLWNRGKNITY